MSESSNSDVQNTKTEILYQDLQTNDESSNEESLLPNLSSIERIQRETEEKEREESEKEAQLIKKNHQQVLFNQGLDGICAKYIALSDSGINLLAQYPPLKDPGIKKALFEPRRSIYQTDDGQELYTTLCKETNACPVRLFHRGLITSEIDLSYYGINPKDVRIMAKALNNNRCVEILNLTENFLTIDACYHLGQMLYTNRTLEEMNLAGCRIGSAGLYQLGKSLHLNRTITALNLAGNDIGEDGGIYIAKIMLSGATVKRFNLSKNGLSKRTAIKLTDVFLCRDYITHLDLSQNQLYLPPTSKMLKALSYSKNLQELNLAWNALEGEHIADSIKDLMVIPTLTILDISNNRFTGDAITIIVNHLIWAKKLVTLDLSSNPLKPKDALTALEQMLYYQVNLHNLLMNNVPVNRDFLRVLRRVHGMKCRANFIVTYDAVIENWTIKGADARELVLKRADYLATCGNRKGDVVQLFLNLRKEKTNVDAKDLPDVAADHGIHLDVDLAAEMASVFPGPQTEKTKFVNLDKLCDYIERLWPERLIPKPQKNPKLKHSKQKSVTREK